LGQSLILCLLFRNDITALPFPLGLTVTTYPILHDATKRPQREE